MKLYSAAPGASISMMADPELRRLLVEIRESVRITHILETGTYLGLGSTKFLAEIFAGQSPAPQLFVTIEANYFSWRRARRNLRPFPFVTALWGLSIAREEALSFVRNDRALKNHFHYPDIFIDDINDPLKFYSSEIGGHLGGGARNPIKRLQQLVDRRLFYAGEDLLATWLAVFRFHAPLVVLDSAGGVGYLEFKIVQECMHLQPYFLLLDDIHHLKHFRSYEDVRANAQFEVIGENKEAGWLFAGYKPLRQGQL